MYGVSLTLRQFEPEAAVKIAGARRREQRFDNWLLASSTYMLHHNFQSLVLTMVIHSPPYCVEVAPNLLWETDALWLRRSTRFSHRALLPTVRTDFTGVASQDRTPA